MNSTAKDYNSISPTAEYLVRLKALTQIPFAKEAAAILNSRSPAPAPAEGVDPKAFIKWLIHFENRYWTVEKLLRKTHPQHILEISSGYSFRGLAWCFEKAVHFIDTDLPDVVASKSKLTEELVAGHTSAMKGKPELLPLNVMDTESFNAVINRFGEGAVSIVNEGLLMYLGGEEKKKLCNTIREVLITRGGYWITGDVYVRQEGKDTVTLNAAAAAFRKQHRIDENMFSSFEEAEQLFVSCGLEVMGREGLAIDELSCLDLPGVNKNEITVFMKSKPLMRESWCLRAK